MEPMLVLGGLFAVGAIVAVVLVQLYNRLIELKNTVKLTEGGVNTVLQKRFDLIPNLVECVKAYTQHEAATLSKVTEMRNVARQPNCSTQEQLRLADDAQKLMSTLVNVAVEAYPDLKANDQFLNLQRTLTDVEEQLSAARRGYNSAATTYNNALEMFPSNVVANAMALKAVALFELSAAEAKQAPTLKGAF